MVGKMSDVYSSGQARKEGRLCERAACERAPTRIVTRRCPVLPSGVREPAPGARCEAGEQIGVPQPGP